MKVVPVQVGIGCWKGAGKIFARPKIIKEYQWSLIVKIAPTRNPRSRKSKQRTYLASLHAEISWTITHKDLWGLRLTAGRRQKQTRQAEPGLNSTPAAYILGEVAPTSAQVGAIVVALPSCCCCCWPMLALFGRSFAPVLALGWPMSTTSWRNGDPGSPHLGRCWPYLGLCSPYLGLMSAHVAHILADVGPMLAQACPYLSRMLTHRALMSAHVAHILADVGPMLAQACPYLSLMLTHVAHILAAVGPMLAPRPSRCPVFRSGPLPKTQNLEKPMVF